jgi:hypothetical protein
VGCQAASNETARKSNHIDLYNTHYPGKNISWPVQQRLMRLRVCQWQ